MNILKYKNYHLVVQLAEAKRSGVLENTAEAAGEESRRILL